MSTFALFKRFFGSHDSPAERRQGPRVNARQGTRILLIDDSSTILAVLSKLLTQNGYEVIKALDAESGIDIARRERPELIFLDVVLPGMSGFVALRLLRRDPLTQATPVIMMSGNVQATEQFYVQRIGADDFMKKPFSRAELFGRIEQLVERGRLPAQPQPITMIEPLPGAGLIHDAMVVDGHATVVTDIAATTPAPAYLADAEPWSPLIHDGMPADEQARIFDQADARAG